MKRNEYSWSAVMRYCYFVLNIQPKDFWDMTILEILSLSKELNGDQGLITKRDLSYLVKKFA